MLSTIDKIKDLCIREENRQKNSINLIASENFLNLNMRNILSSAFVNKYAEGLPNSRYYQGCINADEIENICIKEAKVLFKSQFANVQPLSGSQANQAVLFSLLKPGDKIVYLNLKDGGHLSHGSKINISGKYFNAIPFFVDDTYRINYEAIELLIEKEKPKLLIAGFSSYVYDIRFDLLGSIAKRNDCLLLADISHTSGLITSDLLNHPFPYADIVTSTTHKTLRGPKGAVILWNDDNLSIRLNRGVFPGIQGGPMINTIACKSLCFAEAQTKQFKSYAKQVIQNSKVLYRTLKSLGVHIAHDETDNHINLIKVYDANLRVINLEENGIICNVNYLPLDGSISTGIRIGTAAMTTRGLIETDFIHIAKCIYKILNGNQLDLDDREQILNRCINDSMYFL